MSKPYEFFSRVLQEIGWLSGPVATLLFAIALFGLFFLLKNRIVAAVQKEIGRDLEGIRKSNQMELEKLRNTFAQENEFLRASYHEQIKHIRADYQRIIEDYKEKLKIRAEAAKVAQLLAHVYSFKQDLEKFHKMAWELALWLPADIVRDLTTCLCKVENAPTEKQVLILVRKHLLGDDVGDLQAEQILHADALPYLLKQQ